jgi:Sulfotransferase domain
MKQELEETRLGGLDRSYPIRQCHAYGVGMAKSGTHSVAAIFRQYRALHEPQPEQMIDAILAAASGALTPEQQDAFLVRRDRDLQLEIDVSQLNYFFIVELVNLFPSAKFILTVRDCYSWLDSLINHQLGRDASHRWGLLRDMRFGREPRSYSVEEQILVENDLYTLDGYLSYWNIHNRKVLDVVPPERLLVVRINELPHSLPALAGFLGIPIERLDPSQAHVFPAARRFGILEKLNRDFLDAKVAQHCGELMRLFFPTIQTLKDVI